MAAKDQGSKEHFFRYFQLEATALQERIDKLGALPSLGGERVDAIDHCLGGIAHLHKEVQNASSYIPAHDQKTYAEGIKALHEKLDETRALLKPKSRFAFKSSIKKNDSAISLNDAAELESQQKARLFKDPKDLASSAESSVTPTPVISSPPNELATQETSSQSKIENPFEAHGNGLLSESGDTLDDARIRKMSFAASKSVMISDHNRVHIILPSSASHATSSGSLTNISDAIVNMSMPTTSGKPFATLVVKNVQRSLLICGSVNGAAHVTNVKHSVIVVAARQFRMHDCSDTVVYLHANGQPIIEDCNGVRFAPIPSIFEPQAADLVHGPNQWDQVQDFKWLKAEHSPHWSVLDPKERLPEDQWRRIISTTLELSLNESLAIVGIRKS